MMVYSKKQRLLSYFYLLTIFTLTYYGVWFWPIPMLHYLGIVLGVLISLLLTPFFFSSKQFALFLVYIFIVFINFFTGDTFFDSLKKVIDEAAALFIPMAIWQYYLKSRDIKWLKAVLIVTICIIIWITVATAIIDSFFPGIVRYAQGQLQMKLVDISAFAPFYKIGLSTYILPHALPITIPALAIVFHIKQLRLKHKMIPLVGLVGVMLLLYYGGAGGPMLIGIFSLLVAVIIQPGNIQSLVKAGLVLFLICLPFIINEQLVFNLLDGVDNLINNEGHFHSKIVNIEETILYGESTGDIEERQDLYKQGISAFFNSILIGVNGEIGGHSALLNRLSSLGLVGFIPFIVLVVNQIKSTIKEIPFKYKVYYYVGLITAFLLTALKAIATWETFYFLFVLLPFAIVFYSRSVINPGRE